jgi:hypothetical protein
LFQVCLPYLGAADPELTDLDNLQDADVSFVSASTGSVPGRPTHIVGAARGAGACAAVSLDGAFTHPTQPNPERTACLAAGDCSYVAPVQPVEQACAATDPDGCAAVAMDGGGAAANAARCIQHGACEYRPNGTAIGLPEACVAVGARPCEVVPLDGTAVACTNFANASILHMSGALAASALTAATDPSLRKFTVGSLPAGYAVGNRIVVNASGGAACSCTGNYTVQSVNHSASSLIVAEAVPGACVPAGCEMSRPAVPTCRYTAAVAGVAEACHAVNGALSVSFAAPSDTGGSPITEYRVWFKDSNDMACGAASSCVNTVVASSPMTQHNLRHGVSYALSVYAANQFGYGQVSMDVSAAVPYADCATFSAPPHSRATCHGAQPSGYGAVCEVECLAGFRQQGNTFYECQASGRWQGSVACLDVNECASSPCANGGTCRDSSDSSRPVIAYDRYSCACVAGYFSERCTDYVDPCASSPCLRGGSCVHGELWSYTCACVANFRGAHCELCDKGWAGANCTVDTDECSSSPCFNGGTCYDSFNSWVCNCPLGTTGERCETNVDECLSIPCRGNGACHDGLYAFACDCLPGFIGETCETAVMMCDGTDAANGCSASAKCVYTAGWGSPTSCICDFGKRGNGTHCQDIDECGSHPCQHGGTCTQPAVGYFACSCAYGYEGARCDVEVFGCSSSPCAHGGQCIDTGNVTFACVCNGTGYIGSTCDVNVDDCGSSPCLHRAVCTDRVRAYECDCAKDAVTGETKYSGAECQVPKNLCALQTDDCDRLHSSCHYTGPGTYICQCDFGYSSSDGGLTCRDIDECEVQPSGAFGSCALQGTERCLDSSRDIGVALGASVCECKDGFAGERCELVRDACITPMDMPCRNGGTCVAHGGYYTCECVPAYDGYNCEAETDECRSSPCGAFGTCADAVLSFSCTCDAGWGGDRCDQEVDECQSNPCLNGATCDHTIDAFTCACGAGFYDTRGQCGAVSSVADATACDAEVDSAGVRVCVYRPARAGTGAPAECVSSNATCGLVINECSSNPCQNGGVCVDAQAAFQCQCRSGFEGGRCERAVDPCAQQTDSCDRAHATCRTTGPAQYSCVCAVGWSGPECRVDDLAPVITCAASLTIRNADSLAHSGAVAGSRLLPQVASDNSGIPPSVAVMMCDGTDCNACDVTHAPPSDGSGPSCTPVDLDLGEIHFALGTTVVRAVATDFQSRSASCTLRVTVQSPAVLYRTFTRHPTIGRHDPLLGGTVRAAALDTTQDEGFFELANSGSAPLWIDDISVDVNWAFIFQGGAYSQLELPFSIGAQQSFRVGVLFHGRHVGAGVHRGVASVTTNDPRQLMVRVPLEFAVQATAPYAVFSPQTLPQPVLEPLQTRVSRVTLYNSRESTIRWSFLECDGNAYFTQPRQLGNIWYDEANALPVKWLAALPECSGVIPPGASAALSIHVTSPWKAGAYQATVGVRSSCYDACPAVKLNGNPALCTGAGRCVHTAAVAAVPVSCNASDYDACTYAQLDGTSEACTQAGLCTYTSRIGAVSEDCSATAAAACAGAARSYCAAAGGCTYTAATDSCVATDHLTCATAPINGSSASCLLAGYVAPVRLAVGTSATFNRFVLSSFPVTSYLGGIGYRVGDSVEVDTLPTAHGGSGSYCSCSGSYIIKAIDFRSSALLVATMASECTRATDCRLIRRAAACSYTPRVAEVAERCYEADPSGCAVKNPSDCAAAAACVDRPAIAAAALTAASSNATRRFAVASLDAGYVAGDRVTVAATASASAACACAGTYTVAGVEAASNWLTVQEPVPTACTPVGSCSLERSRACAARDASLCRATALNGSAARCSGAYAIAPQTLTSMTNHAQRAFQIGDVTVVDADGRGFVQGDTIAVDTVPAGQGTCPCSGAYTVATVDTQNNRLLVAETVAAACNLNLCKLSRPAAQCTHVAYVAPVAEACAATDGSACAATMGAAESAVCAAAGTCAYTAPVGEVREACTGNETAFCAAVDLRSPAEKCAAAPGACYYVPANATARTSHRCSATHAAACAAASAQACPSPQCVVSQSTCVAADAMTCLAVALDSADAVCAATGKCAFLQGSAEACRATDASAPASTQAVCAAFAADGTAVPCLAAGRVSALPLTGGTDAARRRFAVAALPAAYAVNDTVVVATLAGRYAACTCAGTYTVESKLQNWVVVRENVTTPCAALADCSIERPAAACTYVPRVADSCVASATAACVAADLRPPLRKCAEAGCAYTAPVAAIAKAALTSATDHTARKLAVASLPLGYAPDDAVLVDAVSAGQACACAGSYTVESVDAAANFLIVREGVSDCVTPANCELRRPEVAEACAAPAGSNNQTLAALCADAAVLLSAPAACAARGACAYVAPVTPVQESCLATTHGACEAVPLNTSSSAADCRAAAVGTCSYTAPVTPRAESCAPAHQQRCQLANMTSLAAKCHAAGECMHVAADPPRALLETCAATHRQACEGVALNGLAATCTQAGFIASLPLVAGTLAASRRFAVAALPRSFGVGDSVRVGASACACAGSYTVAAVDRYNGWLTVAEPVPACLGLRNCSIWRPAARCRYTAGVARVLERAAVAPLVLAAAGTSAPARKFAVGALPAGYAPGDRVTVRTLAGRAACACAANYTVASVDAAQSWLTVHEALAAPCVAADCTLERPRVAPVSPVAEACHATDEAACNVWSSLKDKCARVAGCVYTYDDAVRGVREACAAADLDVCANVCLNGQPGTCTAAGECTHTPAVLGVQEACLATDSSICDAVTLTGSAAPCTQAHAIAAATLAAATDHTARKFAVAALSSAYRRGDTVVVATRAGQTTCACAGTYTVEAVSAPNNWLVVNESVASPCVAQDCTLARPAAACTYRAEVVEVREACAATDPENCSGVSAAMTAGSATPCTSRGASCVYTAPSAGAEGCAPRDAARFCGAVILDGTATTCTAAGLTAKGLVNSAVPGTRTFGLGALPAGYSGASCPLGVVCTALFTVGDALSVETIYEGADPASNPTPCDCAGSFTVQSIDGAANALTVVQSFASCVASNCRFFRPAAACTYTAAVAPVTEKCHAADELACSLAPLGSGSAPCLGSGKCTYVAPVTLNPEACVATHASACAAVVSYDPTSMCAAAGECSFTTPVDAVAEACAGATPVDRCLVTPAGAAGGAPVLDANESVTQLEVSLLVQPGAISAARSSAALVTPAAPLVAGVEFLVKVSPFDGRGNAMTAEGLQFVAQVQPAAGPPRLLVFPSFFSFDTQEYFVAANVPAAGQYTMTIDALFSGGARVAPLASSADVAEELPDSCKGHTLLHTTELDFPNYRLPAANDSGWVMPNMTNVTVNYHAKCQAAGACRYSAHTPAIAPLVLTAWSSSALRRLAVASLPPGYAVGDVVAIATAPAQGGAAGRCASEGTYTVEDINSARGWLTVAQNLSVFVPESCALSRPERPEACAASDETACAAVQAGGSMMARCLVAGSRVGACAYTAPVSAVAEACDATDPDSCAQVVPNGDPSLCTGHPQPSGQGTCVYVAPAFQVAEACVSPWQQACGAVALSGDPQACTGAGACTHTPAVTPVAEACAATDLGACAAVALGGTYTAAYLEVGAQYATGKPWTFTGLPLYLSNALYLKTPDTDKDSSALIPDWLCFTLDRAATVFVLYDNRSATPPAWLVSSYQRVTEGGAGLTPSAQACSLSGSELCADAWDIYFADHRAGARVCLGGNAAPGTQKMYIPAVGPLLYHECARQTEARTVRELVGVRIPGVAVSRGAHVHNTTLSFVVREAFDAPLQPVDILITAAAADSAPAITGANDDLSSRPTLGHSVVWRLRPSADPCAVVPGTQACGAAADGSSPHCVPHRAAAPCRDANRWATVHTPDLSVLVRSVVHRPGWAAGNALLFLLSSEDNVTSNVAKVLVGTTPTLHYAYGAQVASFGALSVGAVSCPTHAAPDPAAGSAVCRCLDGYHPSDDLDGGSCEPCPTGYHGVNESCARCPHGTEPTAARTSCVACAPTQAGRWGQCATCEAGKRAAPSRTACAACPSGTVGADGSCASCVAGTQPDPARSRCLGCAARHASALGVACTVCPPGTEPNAARTACVACPAAHAGSDGSCARCGDGRAPNNHSVGCDPCPPGTAGLDGVCTSCPAGTTPTLTLTGCSGCPSGTESSGGVCVACRRGWAGVDGVCAECPFGKGPDARRIFCVPCPAGHVGRNGTCFACGEGQRPNAELTACSSCPKFTYSATGISCDVCPAGRAPSANRTRCVPCPAGVHSADGRECVRCAAGFEPTAARDGCRQCVGRYSNGQRCLACRLGERPAVPFQAVGCVACATLGGAWVGADGVACERCARGRFPTPARTACLPCLGELDNRTGANASYSPDGGPCRACAPGYEPDAARSGCVRCAVHGAASVSVDGGACAGCAPGTQPNPQRTACLACPAGTHSPDGTPCRACRLGEAPAAAQTACARCALNLVSPNGSSCVPCAAEREQGGGGAYLNRYLQPNAAQSSCYPCPPDTYFIPTAHACHHCASGAAAHDSRFAGPGYRLTTNRSRSEPCVQCGVGEWGDDGRCHLCAPGLYANEFHTQCLNVSLFGGAHPLPDLPTPASLRAASWGAGYENGSDWRGWIGVGGVPVRCLNGTQPRQGFTRCDLCPLGRYSGDGIACGVCPPAHEPNQLACTAASHLRPSSVAGWQQPHVEPWATARTYAPTHGPNRSWLGSWGAQPWGRQPWAAGGGLSNREVAVRPAPAIHDGAAFTAHVGATGCVRCAAGWYSADGRACETCAPGAQPNASQTGCVACGAGQISVDGRRCVPCRAGYEPDATPGGVRCLQCVDTHSPDGVACVACAAGQRPTRRFASVNCTDCAADGPRAHGPDGVRCALCGPGQEADRWSRGAAWARQLTRAATTPVQLASPNLTHNTGCTACARLGRHTFSLDGQPCTRCGVGQQPNANRTGCLACVGLGPQMISPDGTPCTACAPASEPDAAHGGCTPCEAGTQNGAGHGCAPCGPGQQPNATQTGCMGCAELGSTRYSLDGRRCLFCPHGKMPNPGESSCMRCPAGRAGVFGRCDACAAGRYPNVLRTTCLACGAGRYNTDGALCVPCFSEGFATPRVAGEAVGVGAVACEPCANGTTPNAVRTRCVPCPKGWAQKPEGPAGVCAPCEGGHRPLANGTACEDCPAGTISTNGEPGVSPSWLVHCD